MAKKKEETKPAKEENKKQTEEQAEEQPQQETKKKPERNARGQFEKGRAKTGGRQLGTKNKYSGSIRDRVKEQIEPFINNLGELIELAKKQDGAAEAAKIVEKFLPYFTPKYTAISVSADQDRPLSEEEELLEMDQKYKKKELEINIKSLVVVDNDRPSTDEYDPDDDPDFDMSLLEEAEQDS